MAPTLLPGDVVFAVVVAPEQVGIGDVIVYGHKVQVCHRVFWRFKLGNRWYFIDKGDGCTAVGLLSEGRLRGRVVEYLDEAGDRLPLPQNRAALWLTPLSLRASALSLWRRGKSRLQSLQK